MVQELAVTTIGGVVEAAQALMKIVPDGSKLVLRSSLPTGMPALLILGNVTFFFSALAPVLVGSTIWLCCTSLWHWL
ncbi:hypothetical protein [Thalassospira povalilytica]|uniref:hypothetical protein n=1 Tax=Thalassospira povalilytica TaxID=732237 RepID=UPI003899D103